MPWGQRRGANNKSIGQIRWPTLLWDQSQHSVPHLPASAHLRAANKQNCHLSQAPRGRERGRRRRWSDNFLCSVWQMFLFCFLYIFLHCWWSCCALSGHERGRGGREVCLSAIFPLILSRFVACFIHFFLVFFFTSCPVYLRVCVGASVSVCVCHNSDR